MSQTQLHQQAQPHQQASQFDGFALEFAGQRLLALTSGALYWPEIETLLVADLHLEKMSSYAKSRQFLPPYDTGATLNRLACDIKATGAKSLIALGDSFHRDEGTTTLNIHDADLLAGLTQSVDWLWLAGNHDPSEHELGGRCSESAAIGGLILSHEPSGKIEHQIAGHLHPAARVSINGRSIRRACFVYDHTRMIMPAYGVSTGSLNVLDPAFSSVIDRRQMQVAVLGKDQIYLVGRRHLIGR
ncbi:ligase-associated DNA damage response endonuclease PdeM [Maritalea sp.]|uniref:ligase-associated DNA damage response endonuclease PdeM n=1 Tax=Maritalea sp. TaxID=2003361 RepID=UPI003EF7C0C7